jgi:lysyl-tRNA synthetase class 2
LPWERISVVEVFAKYAKIDLTENLNLKEMKQTVAKKGYQVSKKNTWEELYNQIYLNEIELHLGKGKPTIIYDYPSAMGALAKKKKTDPRFAERFEIYIGGLELGDCYSELTDAKEQADRFNNEMQEIKRLGKTQYPIDLDFIEALKAGLPKCSGLAMGVDRLIMLFANVAKIQDILFFPAEELW